LLWGAVVSGLLEAAIASRAESPSEAIVVKLRPGPGKSAAEVEEHQRARIHGAMLEIVAGRGYVGVSVRDLARNARISTRSFYQHYPNKEACFLGVHQLAVRRVLRCIEAASLGAGTVAERLRLVVGAIVREWASDPRAARLMLLDAYAAGLPALKQARLASRSIEARIGECLDCASDDTTLVPLAAEGIVSGVFTAARSALLDGNGGLGDLADPLGCWAASYCELPAKRIEDVEFAHPGPSSKVEATAWIGGEEGEGAPHGDRALLLTAAARLVTARGDADLGVEDLASTAGISRRGFNAEFPDPEACIAAAHGLYADRAIDHASRASDESVPAGDARPAIASLATELVIDPALATLCFTDVAISGPRLAHSHHRFLSRVARLIAGEADPASVAAEASAGALWGPLRQRMVMGRVTQAWEIAPDLASLSLLPLQAEASPLFVP
jgi:AcrR family transcriptional regulator